MAVETFGTGIIDPMWNNLPIYATTKRYYTILRVNIPNGVSIGDEVHAWAEFLSTNDSVRKVGLGVALVTQLRLLPSPTVGGFRAASAVTGLPMNAEIGGQNISQGAHHGEKYRAGRIVATSNWPTACIEFLAAAKTLRENGRKNLTIDNRKGQIFGVVYRAE